MNADAPGEDSEAQHEYEARMVQLNVLERGTGVRVGTAGDVRGYIDRLRARERALAQELDRTNTTGKCDHCKQPVVSYKKGGGPLDKEGEAGEYCACTTRRGCEHRTFRDCPVCALLSGQPVDTELERLRASLTYIQLRVEPGRSGGWTLNDAIREVSWIDDECRAALSGEVVQ